jgi:hypothetical protein
MLFGAQAFSSAPFSSQFAGNVTILANGNQINTAIGNVVIDITMRVNVTGNQINLATNTIDVISWNPIIPGATGVWIPIDPDNP